MTLADVFRLAKEGRGYPKPPFKVSNDDTPRTVIWMNVESGSYRIRYGNGGENVYNAYTGALAEKMELEKDPLFDIALLVEGACQS